MQKLILWLVVGVVILGGGFLMYQAATGGQNPLNTWFGGTQQQNSQADNNTSQPPTGSNNSTSTGQAFSGNASSLKELMDRVSSGQSYRCVVTLNINQQNPQFPNYKYNFYTNGQGRTRVEMWAENNPNQITYSLQVWDSQNSGSNYLWMTGSPQGTIMPITGSSMDFNDANWGNLPEDIYKFDCSPWSADNNMLQPPGNINFAQPR